MTGSAKVFDPFWEDKCWGQVQHIFCDHHASVSLLEVNAGWCCSLHYHEHRGNQFAVQEGVIAVDVGGEVPSKFLDGNVTRHYLGPGETLAVPAGVWHTFYVIEPGRLVEVYWADKGPVRIDDIVRNNEGGPISPVLFKMLQEGRRG